ncbi:hypothetical protein SAY87_027337 [Trapa incisa]|uniref:C3H1-type domain-containing protein n=1 Tax=Trapa incisa TaxID=236973 RepID=A0AAN7JMI0_9MYRT|nr:hypothetical protein SAY87_027337 [Trapa incisa]
MDARKSRNESSLGVNVDLKKFKRANFVTAGGTNLILSTEKKSLSTVVGSKSKPRNKFFSTGGRPYGEGSHLLHQVPGGNNAEAQTATPIDPPSSQNMRLSPLLPNPDVSSQSSVKTRMCSNHNTAEGCKYGEKCHFAHGEWELGKPVAPSADDPRGNGMPVPRRRSDVPVLGRGRGYPAARFGALATAKISVDASLSGMIIGKGGVNSKKIRRRSGSKLVIMDHESDSNLKYVELEGTLGQINHASSMVRELIANAGTVGRPTRARHGHAHGGPSALPRNDNFKTKLCDNFAKGSCTFGDRCHFAHGDAELRKIED